MKKSLLAAILFLMTVSIPAVAQKLIKIWETEPVLKTVESVIYCESTDLIYASCINGNPSEKDGKGFLAVISLNGEIKYQEWVKGLNAPKGLGLLEEKLYVADIDQLVEIDIRTGKILNNYPAPGAQFLNDVTVCPNGYVYVSDMMTKKIHILKDGVFSVWFQSELFNRPNGLFAEKGKLFVGDHKIFSIDLNSKEMIVTIENAGGVDGLEKTHDGDFIFSHWAGRVFLYKNNQIIKLLDTSEQNINSADIDYALKPRLLLVPTFFDNRIVAYKIQP